MNNKKRKLQYIREKNSYRLGGKAISFFKMSGTLGDPIPFDSEEILLVKKQLEKRFKMKFKATKIETGISSDDFANSIFTVRATFKKV